MNLISLPYLWASLGVCVCLGLIWQFVPLNDSAERIHALPLEGPGFEAQELPLSPMEEEQYKGVAIIKRKYRVDGREFFVTALDGTHNRRAVHDPVHCIKASGWEVLSEKDYTLNKGRARHLEVIKNGEKREVLYWFANSAHQYYSPLSYWWDTTLRRMTLGLSGPEPILVVVQPLGGEQVDWDQFSKRMQPLLDL